MPSAWVATLPQVVAWDDYMRELADVADGRAVLNYRIARRLRGMEPGDRFYIVWRGRVRGWMAIAAVADHPDGFRCLTTGTLWPPGVYVQRSGSFHATDGPEMRGFQGVRRFAPAPTLV